MAFLVIDCNTFECGFVDFIGACQGQLIHEKYSSGVLIDRSMSQGKLF